MLRITASRASGIHEGSRPRKRKKEKKRNSSGRARKKVPSLQKAHAAEVERDDFDGCS
jgi:hypothetical protein